MTDALNHVTLYFYDANGNQTSNKTTRTTFNGSTETLVTTSIYDGQNRLIKTIDPLSATNTVVYNTIGKQAQTIDKLEHTTSYTYDDMGRLSTVTYPDNTTESYVMPKV